MKILECIEYTGQRDTCRFYANARPLYIKTSGHLQITVFTKALDPVPHGRFWVVPSLPMAALPVESLSH